MVTVGIVNLKVFQKKGYDIIAFVYDVTNKILSLESNYIVYMGLTLGMTLKFYTSVAKRLKLNEGKFCGLSPMFVEVTGGRGFFAPRSPSPPHFSSWTGLKDILACVKYFNSILNLTHVNAIYVIYVIYVMIT